MNPKRTIDVLPKPDNCKSYRHIDWRVIFWTTKRAQNPRGQPPSGHFTRLGPRRAPPLAQAERSPLRRRMHAKGRQGQKPKLKARLLEMAQEGFNLAVQVDERGPNGKGFVS
jgi:hypothetical protein